MVKAYRTKVYRLYRHWSEELPDTEFTKYTDLYAHQLSVGAWTHPELVNAVRERFYATHTRVYKGFLDHIWARVRPLIEENAGLARFILDHDYTRSEFFYPWLLRSSSTPHTMVRIASGTGYDLLEHGIRPIPPDDPIRELIELDPIFVYARHRCTHIRQCAGIVYDDLMADDSPSPVAAGDTLIVHKIGEVPDFKALVHDYRALKTGGAALFNTFLASPCITRNIALFDWPEQVWPIAAPAAVQALESLRSDLWHCGLKFEPAYIVDTSARTPLAVTVIYTKI